ncbi:hypothetical protein [Aliarcobacter butzleri]|uniref:hypothetical protein n=1 Tax=Aliarcobacter butzleri TaxID=28197 RepID=UPI003ABED71D
MNDKTKSPNVQGVKIWVDTIINEAVSGNPVVIGHIDSIGKIVDKSRNVQKYTPMNDTQFDEIVSFGSLTQAAFSMGILYDPESTEGINIVEKAIDDNTKVQIIIELNNKISPTGKGTQIKQICGVSNFSVDAPKDGKLLSSFNAEKIGLPEITSAS